MHEKASPIDSLLGMTMTGILIGLGQLLGSQEALTPRIVLGRALSSAGLSLVAGLSLLQIPDMPLVPLIALSALIASLGTSALEKFLQHYLGIKTK